MFPIALLRSARRTVLVAATFVSGAFPARAAVTTFAQFSDANILSLPADLQNNQTGTLTLGSRTSSADRNFGGFDAETRDGAKRATTTVNSMIISRHGAAGSDHGQVLLLRVNFFPAPLSGGDSDNFLNLSGLITSSSTVTLTADPLNFNPTTRRGVGRSFSSVLANLSLRVSGLFHRLTAAGTDTLSAEPVPIVVPKADARDALGILVGVAGVGELLRRFRGGWARAGRGEIEAS